MGATEQESAENLQEEDEELPDATSEEIDIMDENGSMTLAVEDGDNLTENYVG